MKTSEKLTFSFWNPDSNQFGGEKERYKYVGRI